MEEKELRDTITVRDDDGNEQEFAIEALFDMDDESYALLNSEDDMLLMRVVDDEDGEQYLLGLDNPEQAQAILDAYQVAVEEAPAE